eukprot:7641282-Lingulodinium_polyedra.AAC.1
MSHLWQRLQYLDTQSCSLFDAIDKVRSPFRQASRALTEMLQQPLEGGALTDRGAHVSSVQAQSKCRIVPS